MLDAQTMEAHQKKRLLSRAENMHNVKRKKSEFLHWLSLQCKDKLIVKGRGDFTPINYHFFLSFCSFFAALFQYIFFWYYSRRHDMQMFIHPKILFNVAEKRSQTALEY